ncbi:MAG: FAD-binding oxidoreductase [Pseudomonadota bacterium]|nr:FAD-binding oxidoreductase [Pseudomonadota bacterium]
MDVAVIGAGNVGIAVAYYLVTEHKLRNLVLIDPRDPMSLTSAQSGENYRNWWPHPVMTAFTDHAIDLLEHIDRKTEGRLNMTRGGYSLVTRRESPDDLIQDLYRGYGASDAQIRVSTRLADDYQPPRRAPWNSAPDGVDVLLNRDLIRKTFPSYAPDIAAVIHIRKAGSISAQQLGQYMLEEIRRHGGRLLRVEVKSISSAAPFTLELKTAEGTAKTLRAEKIVNAAGPFVRDIGLMLGEDLPVMCVYQQKIAFQDREAVLPRSLPFTIDLDGQSLVWSDEDRELLASEPSARHLIEPMPGGIHCRPDGAADGTWVKLGWAYNDKTADPHSEEPIDPQFPDTVLRGASRLHSGLSTYLGRLPRGAHHYGGYYTMTEENWPLIGRMKTEGAFIAGALSGYGSMAACSTGAVCAAWVAGKPIPEYALSLSSERFGNQPLMDELAVLGKGTL